MIIDFTRDFSDEEYLQYFQVVEKWWDQFDLLRRADEYYDNPIIECPDDWFKLAEVGLCNDISGSLITQEELVWIRELSRKVDALVRYFVQTCGYDRQLYWPDNIGHRTRILKWLEEGGQPYALIYHPHPKKRDLILLPNSDPLQEFLIATQTRLPTEDEYEWLISHRGWRSYVRLEEDQLNPYDLRKWLEGNCEGLWSLGYVSSFGGPNRIYFQLESDLILYKVTFG